MLRILIATIVLLLSVSLAQAACSVDINDLNFGPVDAIGNAPVTGSTEVAINCDDLGGSKITICGNIGTGSAGTAEGMRQSLAPGGGSLRFGLYGEGGESMPWGSLGTNGLGPPYRIVLPVSNGSVSTTLTLHGLVPAGQSDAPIGEYRSDFNATDVVFLYAEGETLDCAAPVDDAQMSAAFSVLASVIANCRLETADLDFGTAGLIGDNIDAETELGLTCTTGTDYSISIDGGGAQDPAHRLLTSGSNSVSYNLYSNSQRTNIWGTAEGSIVSGEGNGAERSYGVYGRIPPQPAAAGAYADTVVVTITY